MSRYPLANWIVNTDQLGAVRKRRFHLHLANHLRDAFHDLFLPQYRAAFGHELGHRLAISCSLHHVVRYQRDGFGVIQLDASCESTASDQRSKRDQKLVPLTRREVHESGRPTVRFSMTTSSERETDQARPPRCIARESCATRVSSRKTASRRSER